MTSLVSGVTLLADFLWQVVTAGITTAWWIVRPGHRLNPAVVQLPYSGISDTGAVVYACLLSLTPGTTTLDLDLGAHMLRLHILDGEHAAQTVAAVRRRFERRLRQVFPERVP